jgi:signal transduction histidine kinase
MELIKHIPHPLIACSGEGDILLANDAMGKLLGYETEALANQPLLDFLKEEKLSSGRVCLFTKAGMPVFAKMSIGETFSKENKQMNIVSFIIEPSETGNREDAELEKLAVAGRIVRNIGHEIKNPLTNMLLSLEQMVSEFNPDESQMFYISMIKRNVNRIDNLINRLVATSKMPELNLKECNLHRLLEESIHELSKMSDITHLRFNKNYFRNDIKINLDEEKVKQSIQNILINSVAALRETTQGKIDISTDLTEDSCYLTISDNGAGISNESLGRIFEPLFKERTNGEGLGLTYTRNILLHHKSELFVESEPGAGTKFTIRFKYN